MRLPLMTTRRWMLAIALLAILFTAMVEVPRLLILRGKYLELASKYQFWENRYRWNIEDRQEITRYAVWQPRGPEPSAERLAQMRETEKYYSALRVKYERAAGAPWRPLEPDPAPPL